MRVLVRLGAAASLVLLMSCTSTPPSSSPTSTSPSSPSSTSAPVPFSTTRPPTSTSVEPSALPEPELPDGLEPNAVEDECLLTPQDFTALAGRPVARAENTELADVGARRSCFYTASGSTDPIGRIDVYTATTAPARDLVARVAANSTGSRPVNGVGDGAVVVPSITGSFEFVVASGTLLVVLTLPSGTAATPPADTAWTAAGTALIARLPA